jgi:acyl dehydratase
MTDVSKEELTGDDVSIGDASTLVEKVSRIDIVKYAGASGDFNPLHVDESYARQAGNPSVFAHGMLTMGLASRMLTDWFGTPNVDRFRVRFMDRVWPSDTLTVGGEITELESIDGSVRVDVAFAVENQAEKTVLRGDATATLPAE